MDLAKRQTWGELNPITGQPDNSKADNGRKLQNRKRELPLTCLRLSFSWRLMDTVLPENMESQLRWAPFRSKTGSPKAAQHKYHIILDICLAILTFSNFLPVLLGNIPS